MQRHHTPNHHRLPVVQARPRRIGQRDLIGLRDLPTEVVLKVMRDMNDPLYPEESTANLNNVIASGDHRLALAAQQERLRLLYIAHGFPSWLLDELFEDLSELSRGPDPYMILPKDPTDRTHLWSRIEEVHFHDDKDFHISKAALFPMFLQLATRVSSLKMRNMNFTKLVEDGWFAIAKCGMKLKELTILDCVMALEDFPLLICPLLSSGKHLETLHLGNFTTKARSRNVIYPPALAPRCNAYAYMFVLTMTGKDDTANVIAYARGLYFIEARKIIFEDLSIISASTAHVIKTILEYQREHTLRRKVLPALILSISPRANVPFTIVDGLREKQEVRIRFPIHSLELSIDITYADASARLGWYITLLSSLNDKAGTRIENIVLEFNFMDGHEDPDDECLNGAGCSCDVKLRRDFLTSAERQLAELDRQIASLYPIITKNLILRIRWYSDIASVHNGEHREKRIRDQHGRVSDVLSSHCPLREPGQLFAEVQHVILGKLKLTRQNYFPVFPAPVDRRDPDFSRARKYNKGIFQKGGE